MNAESDDESMDGLDENEAKQLRQLHEKHNVAIATEAIRKAPMTPQMHAATAAAAAAFELEANAIARIEAYHLAVRQFYLSFGKVVTEQLSPVAKLQILLAAAAASAFAHANGEKASLEQFVSFLTDQPEDSLSQLSNALEEHVFAISNQDRAVVLLNGFDTDGISPN